MFQKAWNILKKDGIWVFICRAGRKLLTLFFEYNTYFILEKDLKEEITLHPAKIDMRFSLLLPSELDLLCDKLDYDKMDLIHAPSWLAQGDKCFVGYVNNQYTVSDPFRKNEKSRCYDFAVVILGICV